jgi:hypothetical protein
MIIDPKHLSEKLAKSKKSERQPVKRGFDEPQLKYTLTVDAVHVFPSKPKPLDAAFVAVRLRSLPSSVAGGWRLQLAAETATSLQSSDTQRRPESNGAEGGRTGEEETHGRESSRSATRVHLFLDGVYFSLWLTRRFAQLGRTCL